MKEAPKHPPQCQCLTCSHGHKCHVPHCERRCPPHHLMCLEHWRKVPRELQRAVWAHYIKGQEAGRRRPVKAWFDAAKAAIEAVVRGDDGTGQTGLFDQARSEP